MALVLSVLAAVFCRGAAAVVGGRAISIQVAPWAVSIRNAAEPKDATWCTGVVLDARQVLTAGHCLYDLSSNALIAVGDLSVVAGVSSVGSATKGAGQMRRVVSARAHPYFRVTQEASADPPADDVAVLTLAKPLDLSGPDVKPVGLAPADGPYPTNRHAVFAAFGDVGPNAAQDGVLHVLLGTVLAQGHCGLGRGPGYENILQFNAVELCARSSGASCGGDSGAGLVTVGKNPILLGILNKSPAESSRCQQGIPTQFAYVGAGEISSWIVYGDPHPPRAPTPGYSAMGSHALTLHAGDWVDCSPPSATKGARVRYTFATTSGAVRQTGQHAVYILRRADVGKRILCQTTVANAGGTTISLPTVDDRVKP